MAGRDDPRSEAEKARADLARNAELGMAVPESPLEQQPSVTPRTFGDTSRRGQLRTGTDIGIEAGGVSPGSAPGGPQSPVEAEQATAGRDRTSPTTNKGR